MKRRICLLISLVMLCTVFLSACNDRTDNGGKDNSETVSIEDGLYVPDIPERNYDGRTFTFLTCGVNADADSEMVYNQDGNEKIATVVNDAIAERNRLVAERLNVEIKEQYVVDTGRKNSEFANTVRTDVSAGAYEYQVIVPCIYDGATLAASGYLYDLLGIPYLNMSQPWWDQTFNEELTINNKLYFTVGDLGTINKSATAAMMFNKNLIEQYDLDNPYELVKEKKWTMDRAFEMAKSISSDDNNDGKIDYNDSMGWSGQLDDMWGLFYASGEKIGSIGSDGYPILTMYNERSTGVIDKMLELVQDKNHYISANDYFDQAQWPAELTIKPFIEGRCLFFSALVMHTSELKEMEDDFGVLPLPMYNDSQDSYHSLINPWVGNCFAVPVSVNEGELEFIGIVLEALGAESRNHVYEAYYEVALKYQNTRDDDSIDMLDTIFTSRGCDIGIIYAWGGLDVELQNMAYKTPGSFTSTYEAVKGMAESQLKTTVDFYKDLD